jgi:hypothetical protein
LGLGSADTDKERTRKGEQAAKRLSFFKVGILPEVTGTE